MFPFVLLIVILIGVVILAHKGNNNLEGKNIIIDPGHGGIDPGATDNRTFFEKDVNLDIAKKLKNELESKKACVYLTRETDISLDYQNNFSSSRHNRDLLARITHFNSGKYDIFISIHVNKASSARAMGSIVFYSPEHPHSAYLADYLQNSLNNHIKKHINKNAVHMPVKSNFFILRNSEIPGVIVETGFMSNPQEKKLLQDDSYRMRLAQAICKGVETYFKNIDNFTTNSPADDIPEDMEDFPYDTIDEVRLVENKP